MCFVSFLFQSVSLFFVAFSCVSLCVLVLCCVLLCFVAVFFSVMLHFVALPVAPVNDEGLTLKTSVL